MKRENVDKTRWEPSDSDRVCSDHFVDGEPTPSNPNPSISLGYFIYIYIIKSVPKNKCFQIVKQKSK